MANQTHSTITDPEIHETKGYKDAAAGTVKMATGSGASTFNRPLELISSGTIVSSVDVVGLEDYRTLILVGEEYLANTSTYWQIRLSNNNGSSFISSGYKVNVIDQNSDNLNPVTNGLISAYTDSSTNKYAAAVTIISNFNSSADYTSCSSKYTSRSTAYTLAPTIAGSREPGSAYSYYPTAEAHNAIRLVDSAGVSFNMHYTLWGIRG